MGFSGRPIKISHPTSLVKDSLVVQSCNKIFGNTLIDTNMNDRDNRIWQCSEEHFVRQLKTKKPFTLIKDLCIWVHESQREETCADLIWDLTKMNEDEQMYLSYLQKPKIICTTGKRQMDLPVTIHMLDTLESFSIKALVDSGCMGSCINSEFVT